MLSFQQIGQKRPDEKRLGSQTPGGDFQFVIDEKDKN
jgi:hypothetical protein